MNKKYARIDIVRGVEGIALYINDFRVVGPKPWGGGKYIKQWESVNVSDILKAIGLDSKKLKGIDFFDKNDNG